MTPAALVVLLTLANSSAGPTAPVPRGAGTAPELSAPVAYRDLMLVLVNKDGAAAVVFNPTADGREVEYSFRYESSDGKKQEGSGKLFERRLKALGGGFDPEGLSIATGPVAIRWSYGNADRGWIYYAPEVVTVHLVHAQKFKPGVRRNLAGEEVVIEQLDLRRFMKK